MQLKVLSFKYKRKKTSTSFRRNSANYTPALYVFGVMHIEDVMACVRYRFY